MAARLSRRQFFRLGLGDLAPLIRREQRKERKHLRPPGALADEEVFLATCQRCGKCAEACPYGVIELLGPAAGRAEGTPVLEPAENPCRWCDSMDCVNACPSGALSLESDGNARPIGKATLHLDRCLTSQGILCDECAAVCPASVRAIRMVGRQPQLDEEVCVGCGLCAHYCASEPVAIDIVGDRTNSVSCG